MFCEGEKALEAFIFLKRYVSASGLHNIQRFIKYDLFSLEKNGKYSAIPSWRTLLRSEKGGASLLTKKLNMPS